MLTWKNAMWSKMAYRDMIAILATVTKCSAYACSKAQMMLHVHDRVACAARLAVHEQMYRNTGA